MAASGAAEMKVVSKGVPQKGALVDWSGACCWWRCHAMLWLGHGVCGVELDPLALATVSLSMLTAARLAMLAAELSTVAASSSAR